MIIRIDLNIIGISLYRFYDFLEYIYTYFILSTNFYLFLTVYKFIMSIILSTSPWTYYPIGTFTEEIPNGSTRTKIFVLFLK